jgi:hypothetical protein
MIKYLEVSKYFIYIILNIVSYIYSKINWCRSTDTIICEFFHKGIKNEKWLVKKRFVCEMWTISIHADGGSK